ncbi:MAG: hypothetical protein OCD03_15045 [Hyphomicrobiales bacterium]
MRIRTAIYFLLGMYFIAIPICFGGAYYLETLGYGAYIDAFISIVILSPTVIFAYMAIRIHFASTVN